MTALQDAQITILSREIRTLKWKNKELGRSCGKQGARIYDLRNEVAALRQALTIDPGSYRNLLANLRETRRDNATLAEENRDLKARVAAAEGGTDEGQ